MSTTIQNKSNLAFVDPDTYEAVDTRPLSFFEEGDIGTVRMSVLESLPNAEVEPIDVEDILDRRTRAVQLSEPRANKEQEPAALIIGAAQLAAKLRATVVCTLVGTWSAIEDEKTWLFRGLSMHHLGRAPLESRRSYPLADFFKPVEYSWSEADFEADQVLKVFNERTHADS